MSARSYLNCFAIAALGAILLAASLTAAAANPWNDAADANDADAGSNARDVDREPESIVEIGAKVQPSAALETPGAGIKTTAIPPCAKDPDLLGLSRVVEIDTAGGPQFGGSFDGRHEFLNDHEVVLTFDDGPMRSHTRTVLAALEAQCTRATFFMIGRMAAADPAMVKEVAAEGHTVAVHTWSHKNLRKVGEARAVQEFEMGVSAVNRAAGGTAAPFFRFPYLSESRAILRLAEDRDIATFWIDVDSKDYLTHNSQDVQRRIMAQLNAKGRGIILMHDIQPSSVGAIANLLKELHLRGYKVVHVTPKNAISSDPKYDVAVTKAFADKSKALSENSLADRSVVWSASPEDDAKSGGSQPSHAPVIRNTVAPANKPLHWQPPPAADNGVATVGRGPKPPPPQDSGAADWLFPSLGF